MPATSQSPAWKYIPSTSSGNPGHCESALKLISFMCRSPVGSNACPAVTCSVQPVPFWKMNLRYVMQPSSHWSTSRLCLTSTVTESKLRGDTELLNCPAKLTATPTHSRARHFVPEHDIPEGQMPHSPPQPSSPHSLPTQFVWHGPSRHCPCLQ